MNADRLAHFVDAHADALALYAARWTVSAEDCVQDAFVELARRTVEPENVPAWLFRVVRNRAINAARGEARRREREQVFARLRPVASEVAFETRFDAAKVAESVEFLPSASNEIIVLRVWSNLSFEEVAAILDCSVSTAHRRYRRALDELRNLLEEPSCPQETNPTKLNCPKS